MLTIRTRFVMIGFLLLGVLSGLFLGYKGGIVIKTAGKKLQNARQNSEGGSPVKSVTVTVQPDEQDLLFDQLRHFAQKNFFAISITSTLPLGGSFYPDSGKLGLAFLRNHFEQRPPEPIPLAVFDDLINDLQSFISEVPSAITTERRHRLIITTTDNWRNEELLAQTKALADKHSLKYEYSFYGDNRCVELEMHGEGFHITTHDCEQDTIEDITIDFFLDYHESSTAISEETLDILLDELSELFDNSDNATVNEEP